MNLTNEQYHWLRRRALQAAPHEVCGFILDSGEIVEIRNVHENSFHNFKMDLQQVAIKIPDISVISGIWHTHPGKNSNPSEVDLRAMRQGAILTDWDYLIVTENEVAYYDVTNYAPKNAEFWEGFVA